MDDVNSISAFQNPARTMDVLGETTTEATNAKVVPSEAEHVGHDFDPNQMPMSPRMTPISGMQGMPGMYPQQFGPSANEVRLANEKQEKARIISRLQRLNARVDFPTIQFSESDNLTTLRKLNKVATHAGRAKMTVSFFKRATIFIARILEGLCERFPNKYIDLEGYSEFLMLNISQYDNLLADIYDFYAESIAEMSPIMAYIGAIGSNMIVYSISRKLMGNNSKKKKQDKEKEDRERIQRERDIKEMLERQARRQNNQGSMTGPMSGPSEKVASSGGGDDFESVTTTREKQVRFSEPTKDDDEKTVATTPGSPSQPVKIQL